MIERFFYHIMFTSKVNFKRLLFYYLPIKKDDKEAI